MPRICGSHGLGKAKEVGGCLKGLLLSLRKEYRDLTWPESKRLRAVYSSVGFVMTIRAGVSLMVAWGGLLRGDLQPRATVRESFFMQISREGILCRKIAVMV